MDIDFECVYKSFQGSGSIYIGPEPSNQTIDLLDKYTIRAILYLTKSYSSKPQYPSKYKTLILPISSSEKGDLREHFTSSYEFIDKQRVRTNILICSSESNSQCMVFVMAFLMKKYQYDLQYVERLFPQNLKCLNIPPIYEQQLKRISVEFEIQRERQDEKLGGSRIGRRIVRIRRDYGNISNWSRFGSLPKNRLNPEIYSARNYETAKLGVIQPTTNYLPTHSRRRSVLN